jgi:CheY-like chemotaxis protein
MSSLALESLQPTILVVEDEGILRQIMARTLEGMGYRVIAAETGAVAWELLQLARGSIDAVVSDVVMPRLGGLELAARLRSLPKPPPIILVSGYAKPTTELDCPFLPKPFAPGQLAAAVQQLLNGRA